MSQTVAKPATDLAVSPRPVFRTRERLLGILESISVFIVGVAVMHHLYAVSPAKPGDPIGVPEHDSFYHVRMATMLVEQGLPQKFPWLQYSYFRRTGDDFVSHHVGFHALLAPFVFAARALTGDDLAGGRWAVCAFFGVNLLLFDLLLRRERVPLRWFWLALFLVLPDQFLSRHASVRAIGASLMLMQLILLALFHGRAWLAALALTAYVHLYLGAVTFGPPLVIAYVFSCAIGRAGERRILWQLALITFGGWLLGVLTYPYAAGMWEFLWLQIFGSGLSPETEVGREWLPYTDPWFIVLMAGGVLGVWVTALVMRLRNGPHLNPRELTALLLQFGFLLLMLKARRFVEYWPPICLLSAAYLAGPVLRNILAGRAATSEAATTQSREGDAPALPDSSFDLHYAPFAIAPRLALPDSTISVPVAVAIAVVALCACVAAARQIPGTTTTLAAWPLWLVIGAIALIAPITRAMLAGRIQRPPLLATSIAGATIAALVVLLGAPVWHAASSAIRCRYDLAAVKGVMDAAKQASQPGDIIFTVDWDVFPPNFYFNTYDYYIVGLDPEFTHARDPELWERFVKITRAQTPTLSTYTDHAGKKQRVKVELSDIRTHFKARFVVVDLDHARFSAQLAAAHDLAELIYPPGGYEANKQAPYLLFRIKDAPASGPSTRPGPSATTNPTPPGARTDSQ